MVEINSADDAIDALELPLDAALTDTAVDAFNWQDSTDLKAAARKFAALADNREHIESVASVRNPGDARSTADALAWACESTENFEAWCELLDTLEIHVPTSSSERTSGIVNNGPGW